MDEELLNAEIRKFLRHVGVTSQRELEDAVRAALAAGRLQGRDAIVATMTLSVPEIGLDHMIEHRIALSGDEHQ